MNINTQSLFDLKALKYSATSESATFTSSFIYALARVIEDLESDKVGLTISNTIESLSVQEDLDIDMKYYGVICEGVDVYLRDTGLWGSEDKDTLLVDYERSLRKAHTAHLSEITVYTRLGEIS